MNRPLAAVLALSIPLLAAPARGDEPKAHLVSTDLVTLSIDPAIDANGAVVSTDGSTIAYPVRKAGKAAVVVEGKEGSPYDDVGRIHMGANGHGVSYWAKRDGAYSLVVVDGVEQKVDGTALNVVDGIAVSSDGAHVAYVVRHGGKSLMVLDGKAGKEYDLVGVPIFSPDGKRLAYSARRGEKHVVVVDGQEGPEVDGIGGTPEVAFSPDGKRFGYAAQKGKEWVAMIDGVEGKPFEYVDKVTLPSGGSRYAYVIRTPEGERVVADGTVGDPVESVGRIVFSPDGKRLATAVRREFRSPTDQTWVVTVDGVAGKTYAMVSANTLAFSADSKHVAFVAQQGGKWVAVLDDTAGAPYDTIQPPMFSVAPDGSRLAYAGVRGGKWYRVVGSKEDGPYDGIAPGTPVFGPDGAHTATFVMRGGGRLLFDDIESDPYQGGLGVPVFDGPNAVRILIVRGGKLVRQRVELVVAPN
jgi:hypothetical protein